ncbi:hypothetical protein MRBLWO14_003321 [Microbacterium sp. LWO14-1.2]|uniref:hypothetical protein n=1 Tax=Microbacterium sp. LWO14-1.2 TaxID=3135263 RepID=UPI00313875B9
MKKLSAVLAVLAGLGILVAVSFTVHGNNPNVLQFLPDPITDFTTDHGWVSWIGTAVGAVAILVRLFVESRIERSASLRSRR